MNRDDRERDSLTDAFKKANNLSLPVVFAMKRAGIRPGLAQQYAEGTVRPDEGTIRKLTEYLKRIEKKRKKFYAV
jgi:predicted transcriptional regulator